MDGSTPIQPLLPIDFGPEMPNLSLLKSLIDQNFGEGIYEFLSPSIKAGDPHSAARVLVAYVRETNLDEDLLRVAGLELMESDTPVERKFGLEILTILLDDAFSGKES